MEINRSNIKDIISRCSIKPSKDYGQNFLIDSNVSFKIVEALEVKEGDRVLEIGPGLGSLTHFLSLTKAKINAVDVDNKMTNFLRNVYQGCENLTIVENDIRREDVSFYDKIIGNIPYNITTEIIQYILLNAERAQTMVFMVQAEAFNRFSDIKGKEYGPISILIHLLGNIEKISTVKPGSFYPLPKCNSIVFRIKINEDVDRKKAIEIYKMCKKIFVSRRKTIQNNLTSIVKNKETAEMLCHEFNINPLSRPEDLSPNTYLLIYNYLNR
ncbi:MAG TPA: ribosomal RNA small subunit methyltransferase A [Erysipelotrichaceae bacterium]|nr:ribosomal RNA small subunit methyltransferase A [Erysipelotrichaceae bacterium]